jgi:hypothetical protein
MNERFPFFGRQFEVEQLRTLYGLRRHLLIIGAAGIGKSALLQQVRQYCPLLICEDTSSLRRICDSLERQLDWSRQKLDVIKCKNCLLVYLQRRGEPVAFDHMAHTAPRVARFIAHLGEQIPIWIACRSDQPHEIGHIWPELFKFTRVEVAPLTLLETRGFVEQAVARGNIQADARAHADELHRLSGGNPRILEGLLIELTAREYRMESPFGLDLLDLDRRIRELDLATKESVESP